MEIRNSENYIDETPYRALKNANPKVGEVYMYKTKGGVEYPVLVVAKGDGICTTLRLQEDVSGYSFEVRKPWKTNPYMIQYCFEGTLNTHRFMFSLKDQEKENVQREIEKVFGIDCTEIKEVIAEPQAVSEVVIEERDVMRWYDHVDDMGIIFGNQAVTEFCKMMMYLSQVCNGPSIDYRKSREYIEKNGAFA